jgi:hypothetical protein
VLSELIKVRREIHPCSHFNLIILILTSLADVALSRLGISSCGTPTGLRVMKEFPADGLKLMCSCPSGVSLPELQLPNLKDAMCCRGWAFDRLLE